MITQQIINDLIASTPQGTLVELSICNTGITAAVSSSSTTRTRITASLSRWLDRNDKHAADTLKEMLERTQRAVRNDITE